jgi:hypothetical protein
MLLILLRRAVRLLRIHLIAHRPEEHHKIEE